MRRTMAKRIVVKLGTSTLTAGANTLSRRAMLGLVEQAVGLLDAGHQVVLVSSGAVAAGREALGTVRSGRQVPAKQMLAAVGQTRLMQVWSDLFALFERHVGQVLLTRAELEGRAAYLSARDTLETLLAHGIVPIVNENDTVATDEIRVGDNDNLSALVANLVDADLLVLLSDIEGLYTADPRSDPTAVLIPRVDRLDASHFALATGSGTGLGTGGMVTKLQAAHRAGQSGTVTVIASGAQAGVLATIAAGTSVGTWILPTTTRRESRKRWLLAEPALGTITIDAGAARRLRSGGASLLPVGVRAICGGFERGAVVKIVGADDAAVAVGLARYGADDARKISGLASAQIEAVLGYSFGAELVHRDNMALL
jgi:glutamate 5-kinase